MAEYYKDDFHIFQWSDGSVYVFSLEGGETRTKQVNAENMGTRQSPQFPFFLMWFHLFIIV